MNLLQLREKEIFNTLKQIKNYSFVIIGGYAVNVYTLPRFSVDCDIVINNLNSLNKIEKKLKELSYKLVESDKLDIPYAGEFKRYEKIIKNNFKVSFDILIKNILDRQTDSSFRSEWVFKNSEKRYLKGKTINEKLKLRIIDIDALFVMKFISCRSTDIRDIFMLSPEIKDKQWILTQIDKRVDLGKRFQNIKKSITSEQFRDGLQGVYGFVDDTIFKKHKKALLELKNKIGKKL